MVTGYEVNAYRDLHSIAQSLRSLSKTMEDILEILQEEVEEEQLDGK